MGVTNPLFMARLAMGETISLWKGKIALLDDARGASFIIYFLRGIFQPRSEPVEGIFPPFDTW